MNTYSHRKSSLLLSVIAMQLTFSSEKSYVIYVWGGLEMRLVQTNININ